MSTDLEQRLRNHFTKVADELAFTPTEFRELATPEPGEAAHLEPVSPTPPQRRAWWLAVAAAAVVIVVAGLAAIAGSWNSRDIDSSESELAASPVLLSEVANVDSTEWVIATTLPDDLAWMYAQHPTRSDPFDRRLAIYGTTSRAGTFERLRISVVDDQTTRRGEILEIAGTTWTLDLTEPGRWTASRQLGSTAVVVRDSLPFADADRALLAGLVVVPESGLPTPTLGNPALRVEVARFALGNVTFAVEVQESNGYWCFFVDGSGGCGGELGLLAELAIEGGFVTVADGASTAVAVGAGTATSDTVRIEVEYTSGNVVAVTPTDLSGQFDRKFWVVGATVRADDRSVLEVRAYDADNRLLATATPS